MAAFLDKELVKRYNYSTLVPTKFEAWIIGSTG